MSTPKFTPGPWEAICDSTRPSVITVSQSGGFFGEGHLLIMDKYEGNDADALLIAAAPDLYARVEELTDALSIWEGEGTLPKEWEKLLSDAVDTLREARGEK